MLTKSVGVRKLQVAILALLLREMALTDRILPRYILSRVRVSVRPIIFFIREKTPNQIRPHVVYFNGSCTNAVPHVRSTGNLSSCYTTKIEHRMLFSKPPASLTSVMVAFKTFSPGRPISLPDIIDHSQCA